MHRLCCLTAVVVVAVAVKQDKTETNLHFRALSHEPHTHRDTQAASSTHTRTTNCDACASCLLACTRRGALAPPPSSPASPAAKKKSTVNCNNTSRLTRCACVCVLVCVCVPARLPACMCACVYVCQTMCVPVLFFAAALLHRVDDCD